MNNGSWLYATGFLLSLLSSPLFIFHSPLPPPPLPGWSLSGERIHPSFILQKLELLRDITDSYSSDPLLPSQIPWLVSLETINNSWLHE